MAKWSTLRSVWQRPFGNAAGELVTRVGEVAVTDDHEHVARDGGEVRLARRWRRRAAHDGAQGFEIVARLLGVLHEQSHDVVEFRRIAARRHLLESGGDHLRS